jgi:hypothetical protein
MLQKLHKPPTKRALARSVSFGLEIPQAVLDDELSYWSAEAEAAEDHAGYLQIAHAESMIEAVNQAETLSIAMQTKDKNAASQREINAAIKAGSGDTLEVPKLYQIVQAAFAMSQLIRHLPGAAILVDQGSTTLGEPETIFSTSAMQDGTHAAHLYIRRDYEDYVKSFLPEYEPGRQNWYEADTFYLRTFDPAVMSSGFREQYEALGGQAAALDATDFIALRPELKLSYLQP